MGRRYVGNKSMVLAAVERGGGVKLKVDKRATRNILHKFIKDHTDAKTEAISCLDEFEFRFDIRKNSYLFRDTILRLLESKNLPFEKLTNKDAA